MAVRMLRTGTQYLEVSNYTGPISQRPFSISMWFRDRDAANAYTGLYRFGVSTSNNYMAYYSHSSGALQITDYGVRVGLNTSQGQNWGNCSIAMRNKWHNIVSVHTDLTTRTIYRDCFIASGGMQNLDITTSRPTFLRVGKGAASSETQYNNGDYAEIAIWAKALSAEDRWNLYRNRMSPLLVAPEYLVHYWPLGGRYSNTTHDIIGGNHFYWAGTGNKDFVEGPHGVQYPKSNRSIFLPISSSSGGSGGSGGSTLYGVVALSSNSSMFNSATINISPYSQNTIDSNATNTAKLDIVTSSNLNINTDLNNTAYKVLTAYTNFYNSFNMNNISNLLYTINSSLYNNADILNRCDITINNSMILASNTNINVSPSRYISVVSQNNIVSSNNNIASILFNTNSILTNNINISVYPNILIKPYSILNGEAATKISPNIIINAYTNLNNNSDTLQLNNLIINGNSVLSNSGNLTNVCALFITGNTKIPIDTSITNIASIIAGITSSGSILTIDSRIQNIANLSIDGSSILNSRTNLDLINTRTMLANSNTRIDSIINNIPNVIILTSNQFGIIIDIKCLSSCILGGYSSLCNNTMIISAEEISSNAIASIIFPITLYLKQQEALYLSISKNKNIELITKQNFPFNLSITKTKDFYRSL